MIRTAFIVDFNKKLSISVLPKADKIFEKFY
jgi:hypothetical protein